MISKKIRLWIFGLLLAASASAQNHTQLVTAYQYYFDTDPGVGMAGNGAVVAITPTANFNQTVAITTPVLNTGLHTLYVRTMDEFGKWSTSERSLFYVQQNVNTQTVTALEYYFDTDPGVGNGIPIQVTTSSSINTTLQLGVSCLNAGIHYLYVRAKDEFNRWSVVERDTITITSGMTATVVTPSGPVTACAGNNVVLTGSNIALQGIAYQWLDGGNVISGATGITYSASVTGNYSMRTTCGANTAVSNVVLVTINPTTTYYQDLDNDGFGNNAVSQATCTVAPANYVANNTDCNDADPLEHPGQIWFNDADGDDYGTGTSVTQCARPASGYVSAELIATTGDCNDTSAAIHPGATEIVCNSIDENCNGMADDDASTTSTTTASVCNNTLPYVFNGNNFTATGVYVEHLPNAAGCDSAATLNLTVLQTTTSTTIASVCSGALPYVWNGNNYSATGNYTLHFTNAVGCDSAATLALTVKQTSSSTTTASVCSDALPYVWNGNNYSATGNYTLHFTNAVGCDSAATLALTVKQTSSSTTTASVCSDVLPYVWNGNNYATSGNYTLHFTNAIGCDSAATLVLTVRQTSSSTTTASVCSDALPYVWNGNNYTTTGNHVVHFTNAVGCDSAATLALTVNQTTSSTTTASVCNDALPYVWNGNNYTTSGNHVVHFTNVAGCDSAATLALTVNQTTSSTTTASACNDALPYVWNGNNYSTSGNHIVHFTNAAGCDSAATLALTVNQTTSSTTIASVCSDALPYLWNGNNYSTSGNHVVHFTNAVGCDSAATLALTVNQTSTSTTTASVCSDALPYVWNGNNYSTTGNHVVHFTNAVGCDSAATLALTVNQTTSSTTTASVCNNSLPYIWNGNNYSTSGSFTVHLTNAAGCDSAATLALTVSQTVTSTTTASVCNDALPYVWNGNNYSANGNYTLHFTSAGGCDSAATLALTILQTTTSTTTASVCSDELPFVWNGNNYSASGNYTVHFTNTVGCDSAATLALTVKQTSGSTTTASVCNNNLPYAWNGNNYTTSGNYTIHFTNVVGCDSAATLALTVKQTSASTTTATVCSSALPYVFNGNNYNATGTYLVHLTNAAGCDSAATLNLTVNQVSVVPTSATSDVVFNEVCLGSPVNLTVNGGTLGTGATWNWYSGSCGSSTIGSGATITVSPTVNTTYYVRAQGTCNTTACVQLTITVKTIPPFANVVVPPITNLPDYACNGTVVANISVPAVTGATQYIWDAPTGTTFNGGNNPFTNTSPTATITFGNPNGSGYYIGIQAANSCGTSVRKVQWVRGSVGVPASVDPSVAGKTIYCPNTSATFTCPPTTAATSYLWTITGNATISGTGTTATVNFGAGWTGGTICVAAQTPCYTSPTKCLALTTASVTAYTPSGSSSGCAGSTAAYTVPSSVNIVSYAWTLPSNTTGSSATNSINVNFLSGYSGGNICVTATTICGVALATKCKSINTSSPSKPASITGPLTGLCGQTVVYTCPPQAGVTFHWNVYNGAVINSGQGTNAINVTFGTTPFNNTDLEVKSVNSCGSSNYRIIGVTGKPSAPGAITAIPSTWCANTSGVEFNVNTGSLTGAYTLSWLYPNASVAQYVLGGGNSSSLILNWLTGSGPVYVTASNACGNSTRTSTWASSCREEEEVDLADVSLQLTTYPNPASSVLNVDFYADIVESTTIQLLDVTEKIVMMQTINTIAGNNNAMLDVSKLARGIYLLNVNSENISGNKKVVIE